MYSPSTGRTKPPAASACTSQTAMHVLSGKTLKMHLLPGTKLTPVMVNGSPGQIDEGSTLIWPHAVLIVRPTAATRSSPK